MTPPASGALPLSLICGFEVNDQPQSGWLEFLRPSGERQKHIRALNGALATECASMIIPCFAWDGLDSRSQGGNTRERQFLIIAFGIV
jgi:hypothetical protein